MIFFTLFRIGKIFQPWRRSARAVAASVCKKRMLQTTLMIIPVNPLFLWRPSCPHIFITLLVTSGQKSLNIQDSLCSGLLETCDGVLQKWSHSRVKINAYHEQTVTHSYGRFYIHVVGLHWETQVLPSDYNWPLWTGLGGKAKRHLDFLIFFFFKWTTLEIQLGVLKASGELTSPTQAPSLLCARGVCLRAASFLALCCGIFRGQ